MSTHTLGLYFRENRGPVPGRPISHVYVKRRLGYDYPGAKDFVFLTPREYGPGTVECQIDSLIEELQTIKREVRAKYAAYERKLASAR